MWEEPISKLIKLCRVVNKGWIEIFFKKGCAIPEEALLEGK
jgi:hypothetical protein